MFALRHSARVLLKSGKQGHFGARYASGFVSGVNAAVASLPMREAVRYTKDNVKVTAEQFNKYAESHANALCEWGLAPGNEIAVWMTESMEKHVTLLAAAKIGLKVVDLDMAIESKEDLRAALDIMKDCKSIIFDPVTETSDNLRLLRASIPELFEYDDTMGQPFHSKYYPSLKFFIHTGFDIEVGALNYKNCFVPDCVTDHIGAADVQDSTPLYSSITKSESGITRSKVATHKDALGLPSFAFAKNLIDKKYFEL